MLLVTRRRVTLGRGIVVIAGTEVYRQSLRIELTDRLTEVRRTDLRTFADFTDVYFGSPLSLAYGDSDGDSDGDSE